MKPVLVFFVGGPVSSQVEQMVARFQEAIAHDMLDRAAQTGAFDHLLVVTDRPEFAAALPENVAVEVDLSGTFHFGTRLRRLVAERSLQKILYAGAGLPLLQREQLSAIAHRLSNENRLVLANNLYSADLIALSPATALEQVDHLNSDNALAQMLRLQTNLHVEELPRTAATQFDVDTPSDLYPLALHPGTGAHTRRALNALPLDLDRTRRALPYFTDPRAEIVVAGRVGSQVWTHLERETACRVRLFSEERGMRADGRGEQGRIRSLLGFYLQEVGPRYAFDRLAELGQAAFVDSRVLFGHLGLDPSPADRFYSDLGQPANIQEPTVRAITEAALAAPIPVLLGGHSLVAGGLMALIEVAWCAKELRGRTKK